MVVIVREAINGGVYDVNFHDERIRTMVTSSADVVDKWIACVMNEFRMQQSTNLLPSIIVGLGMEWYHADDNVATLQLCIGKNCLIFQILRADMIPLSLAYFLGNPYFTFVGVGIIGDVQKLFKYFGLHATSTMDLPTMAAAKYGDVKLAGLGLKVLCKKLLNMEMEKPLHVTLSRWDAVVLHHAQIEYACIDAYVSSRLGMLLQ